MIPLKDILIEKGDGTMKKTYKIEVDCANCANKINNKNNIDNSGRAWYIIQAVAWDKTGKCLRAHGNAKK